MKARAGAGQPSEACRALARLLAARPQDLSDVAPGLIDRIGRQRLDEVLLATRQGVGEVRSVAADGGSLTVRGSRGRASAWATCDGDGRVTGLLLRPQSRLEPWRWQLAVAWSYVMLALLPLLLAQAALGAWRATTVAGWLSPTLTAMWLLLLHRGLGWLPAWVMTRAVRALVVVLALVPMAAAVRLPGLRAGGWSSGLTLEVAVLVAVAAACAWSRRPDRLEPVSSPLSSPFRSGTWYVVQGGPSLLLNHHVPAAPQRRALDLVLLRPSGARAAGLFPAALHSYAGYGQDVLAPCDGTVRRIVDTVPDEAPRHARLAPPYGNQVRIDTGRETVVLAHLRPGSVRVHVGQRVRRGDVLGEVGNSGNTSEPHLHLHAERDGVGLAMRFVGVAGPLRRGRRLRPSRG